MACVKLLAREHRCGASWRSVSETQEPSHVGTVAGLPCRAPTAQTRGMTREMEPQI